MTVFWFLAGLFAGINAGIAYTRIRSYGHRSVAVRVGEYTRPDLVPVVLTRLRERLQTDPDPDPGKPW